MLEVLSTELRECSMQAIHLRAAEGERARETAEYQQKQRQLLHALDASHDRVLELERARQGFKDQLLLNAAALQAANARIAQYQDQVISHHAVRERGRGKTIT